MDVLRSSVLRGLETSERGVYTAERQREELGRRLRDRLSGGDGLSRLAAADYAVRPGTSVAITGATEGIGREAARFLAGRVSQLHLGGDVGFKGSLPVIK